MEYRLGLVDALGNIVGRAVGAAFHAHGEDTQTLDRNVAGVGRKGDTVRVPSPLEHPEDAEALRGTKLALIGTTPDGESIIHTLLGEGAEAVAKALDPTLDSRLAALESRIVALESGSSATAKRFTDLEAIVSKLSLAAGVE